MNNTFIDRVNAIVQQSQQPTMSAPTEPVYPDTGIGALENVANNVPRQTMIRNQPHMLAYINPQEEQMLRDMGGSGLPGPDGVPAYAHGGFHWDDTSTYNTDAIGQSISSTVDRVVNYFTPTNTDNDNTVTTTTADNDNTATNTGSNTALQNLTNFVTFAGNKHYVNGEEITVNNLGQDFANWVDGNDNLEYKNNILMDKNTGLEAVGEQAQEAFFNTGEGSQVAIRAADAEAVGVGLSYVNGAPVYTDSAGGTHSTQSGAVSQNRATVNEANRVTADANGITIKKAQFSSFPKYLDNSGERYNTPEEAIAANEILASQVPVNSVVSQDLGQVYDASGNRIDTAGALPTVGTDIPTFANYYDAIDAGYLDKEVIINGRNVIAKTADGYTGAGNGEVTTDVAENTTSVTTEAVGALPADNVKMTGENTMREVFANLFTFGDSAFYEGGTLYGYDKDGNVIDLTGGGETFNTVTGTSNYVYGVSDDPNSGAAIDTTGMTPDEKNVAIAKKQMLYDIPPSDLAYFASFLPNLMMPEGIVGEIAQVASLFGGSIGDLMLDAGIDDRRAIVDQQIASLEAGATPLFNDAGEYIGFDKSTMSTFGEQFLAANDPMSFMPPTSTGTDITITQTDIDEQKRLVEEYGEDGYTMPDYKVGDVISTGDFTNDAYKADANEDGVDDNKRFQTVFDVQSTAAEADPTGMSTQDGFITTGSGFGALDGTEYYIEGDGSVQEVVDGVIKYDGAESGETVESVYGLEEAVDTTFVDEDKPPAVSKIYDRFFRSGSAAGLPAYMARWVNGIDFNERLEKVMVDGQVVYINSKGETIPAEYLESTLRIDEDGNIIETED